MKAIRSLKYLSETAKMVWSCPENERGQIAKTLHCILKEERREKAN